MFDSINKVILLGSVGGDPNIREKNGKKYAGFSLATASSSKNSSGEYEKYTEWHNIFIANSKLSELVERFVTKGTKLYVEGSLKVEEYTDKEGNKKKVAKIIVGFGGQVTIINKSDNHHQQQQTQPANQNISEHFPDAQNILNDEIPF